jgi:hypothetical protein
MTPLSTEVVWKGKMTPLGTEVVWKGKYLSVRWTPILKEASSRIHPLFKEMLKLCYNDPNLINKWTNLWHLWARLIKQSNSKNDEFCQVQYKVELYPKGKSSQTLTHFFTTNTLKLEYSLHLLSDVLPHTSGLYIILSLLCFIHKRSWSLPWCDLKSFSETMSQT